MWLNGDESAVATYRVVRLRIAEPSDERLILRPTSGRRRGMWRREARDDHEVRGVDVKDGVRRFPDDEQEQARGHGAVQEPKVKDEGPGRGRLFEQRVQVRSADEFTLSDIRDEVRAGQDYSPDEGRRDVDKDESGERAPEQEVRDARGRRGARERECRPDRHAILLEREEPRP